MPKGKKRNKKQENKEDKAQKDENESTPSTEPNILSSSPSLLILGMGELGQLGLGEDVMERKKATPVGGVLKGKKILQVVCGGIHTVALLDGGEVYTWGCNDEGALGRAISTTDEYTPGVVKKLKGFNITQVSAGDCHTAALTDNGHVYCWGVFRDADGPLGLINSKPEFEPEMVYSSAFNKAIKVTSGSNHIVILTEHGDIYSFGCCDSGQLGRVPECFSSRGGRRGIGYLLAPQIVRFPKIKGRRLTGKAGPAKGFKVSDIYTGEHCSFAIGSEDRQIYVWGLNHRGQLGLGDQESRFVPEKVPEDWLWDWAKGSKQDKQFLIAGGGSHSLICNDGHLYSMGANEYGQLGLKQTEMTSKPVKLSGISDVTDIACGGRCSFAVTKDGKVFSWGIGSNYQLGCGLDEEDVFEPTLMVGKHVENVIKVSSGGQHTSLLVDSSK